MVFSLQAFPMWRCREMGWEVLRLFWQAVFKVDYQVYRRKTTCLKNYLHPDELFYDLLFSMTLNWLTTNAYSYRMLHVCAGNLSQLGKSYTYDRFQLSYLKGSKPRQSRKTFGAEVTHRPNLNNGWRCTSIWVFLTKTVLIIMPVVPNLFFELGTVSRARGLLSCFPTARDDLQVLVLY